MDKQLSLLLAEDDLISRRLIRILRNLAIKLMSLTMGKKPLRLLKKIITISF
jgi:hypothetical protein